MVIFIEFLCAAADFFSAAEGTFVSIAAAVTAVAAVYGVRTWKRELVGKTNIDVARNLLRVTYKIRDAIHVCRESFPRMDEYPERYEHASSRGKKHAEALLYVYKNRWKPIWSTRQEFDLAAREAEVLWGSDVVAKAEEIRSCRQELFLAIQTYIRDIESDGENFRTNSDFGDEMTRIVYIGGHYGMPADPFGGETEGLFAKRVENAVAGIEEHVRPYMPTRTNRHNRT